MGEVHGRHSELLTVSVWLVVVVVMGAILAGMCVVGLALWQSRRPRR